MWDFVTVSKKLSKKNKWQLFICCIHKINEHNLIKKKSELTWGCMHGCAILRLSLVVLWWFVCFLLQWRPNSRCLHQQYHQPWFVYRSDNSTRCPAARATRFRVPAPVIIRPVWIEDEQEVSPYTTYTLSCTSTHLAQPSMCTNEHRSKLVSPFTKN